MDLIGNEIGELAKDLAVHENMNTESMPFFTRSSALFYDAAVIKILTEYDL
jgi:hypothetical protein